MHGELDVFGGPGARDFRRHILDTHRRAAIDLARMDYAAALAWRAMSHTVKLEEARRKLVGNDPVFEAATRPNFSNWMRDSQVIQQQAGPTAGPAGMLGDFGGGTYDF